MLWRALLPVWGLWLCVLGLLNMSNQVKQQISEEITSVRVTRGSSFRPGKNKKSYYYCCCCCCSYHYCVLTQGHVAVHSHLWLDREQEADNADVFRCQLCPGLKFLSDTDPRSDFASVSFSLSELLNFLWPVGERRGSSAALGWMFTLYLQLIVNVFTVNAAGWSVLAAGLTRGFFSVVSAVQSGWVGEGVIYRWVVMKSILFRPIVIFKPSHPEPSTSSTCCSTSCLDRWSRRES